MGRKEDNGDVGSRADNFLPFVSEKENAGRGKAFIFWVLGVCICYLRPGKMCVTGAAHLLWQHSPHEPRKECGRSTCTPPATTGAIQWALRSQEKTICLNKVCQVFLTSSCTSTLRAHPQPSLSADSKGCWCPAQAACRI